MNNLQQYLNRLNVLHHSNQGITVAKVQNAEAGIDLTKSLLYEFTDKKTILYLSGGRTPKELYKTLAHEEIIEPGAIGMIDERYGKKFHENSNEKMLQGSGLLRYLQIKNIPFYPIIISNDQTREDASETYDGKVRSLTTTFQQSIGIMGIGADGHTSSIAPNRKADFSNPMFEKERQHCMVSDFNDPKSHYGQRIGMTFLGLSLLDMLIVLVFGEDKKEALENIFEEGPEEVIPGRFYKRTNIAPKTLFITDQQI